MSLEPLLPEGQRPLSTFWERPLIRIRGALVRAGTIDPAQPRQDRSRCLVSAKASVCDYCRQQRPPEFGPSSAIRYPCTTHVAPACLLQYSTPPRPWSHPRGHLWPLASQRTTRSWAAGQLRRDLPGEEAGSRHVFPHHVQDCPSALAGLLPFVSASRRYPPTMGVWSGQACCCEARAAPQEGQPRPHWWPALGDQLHPKCLFLRSSAGLVARAHCEGVGPSRR